MLFLTTNRISSIDPAFKSRIHLSLHYPALDSSHQHSVWRNFLTGPGISASSELLEDQNLDFITNTRLNGREIKNVIHIANTLAVSQKTPITHQHLRLALDAISSFEKFVEINSEGEGEMSNRPVDYGKDIQRPRKRKRDEMDGLENFSRS